MGVNSSLIALTAIKRRPIRSQLKYHKTHYNMTNSIIHKSSAKTIEVRRKLRSLVVTMKLEIDLSDRKGLEELRDELKARLEVVEFALRKLVEKNDPIDLAFAESPTSLAGKIVGAITDMSARFKSSDVYNRIPDISRTAIKDVFRQYVDKGRLRIIEQGQGQRPTVYAKTPTFSGALDSREAVEL